MPRFTKSKTTPTRTQSLHAEPSFLVHPLTEADDEAEILSFLAGRPVHAVVMSGLIRDNGLESPFNRGTFYAARNAADRLEGVALIGHATFVEARNESALRAFALLAQNECNAHMILGEQETIGRFWNYYAHAGQRPRLFCRELLFEQRWPVAACAPVAALRRATLEDLMLVMPVHAALAYEESGVNPLDVDLQGFRLRYARRIENGRVWVLVEDGQLIFKAEVAAATPECVYIEGIYVERESRRQGNGMRCLSQLGRLLLSRSKAVCMLVNEQNLVAQTLVMKAGYKLSGYYETIFLERAAKVKREEV